MSGADIGATGEGSEPGAAGTRGAPTPAREQAVREAFEAIRPHIERLRGLDLGHWHPAVVFRPHVRANPGERERSGVEEAS